MVLFGLIADVNRKFPLTNKYVKFSHIGQEIRSTFLNNLGKTHAKKIKLYI